MFGSITGLALWGIYQNWRHHRLSPSFEVYVRYLATWFSPLRYILGIQHDYEFSSFGLYSAPLRVWSFDVYAKYLVHLWDYSYRFRRLMYITEIWYHYGFSPLRYTRNFCHHFGFSTFEIYARYAASLRIYSIKVYHRLFAPFRIYIVAVRGRYLVTLRFSAFEVNARYLASLRA